MYRSEYSLSRQCLQMNDHLHATVVLPSGKIFPLLIGYEVGHTLAPVWTLWDTEKSLVPSLECQFATARNTQLPFHAMESVGTKGRQIL
jgi:hypothetical protein